MKKSLLLISVLFFLFACNSNNTTAPETKSDVSADEVQPAMADLSTISFVVEGMTCTGCENTVKKSCEAVNGVAEVTASFEDKSAVIKYDSKLTNEDELKAAIEEKGYQVVGLTQETEATTDTTTVM